MKRNDFYGDRKIRSMFGCSQLAVLEAKVGEQDFDLEDIRHCISCGKFFDASYFISTVEVDNSAEFVCERCSESFEKLSTTDKKEFLTRCDVEHRYLERELKTARQGAK